MSFTVRQAENGLIVEVKNSRANDKSYICKSMDEVKETISKELDKHTRS